MPRLKKVKNSVLQSNDKYRQTMIGDYFPNSTSAIVTFKTFRIGKENTDNMEESTTKNINLLHVSGNNLITTCCNSSLPFDLPAYKSNNITVPNLKLEACENNISSLSKSYITLKSISSLSANVSSISSVRKHKTLLEDGSNDVNFIPSPKRTRRIRKLSTETEDNSFRSSTNLNLESFENNISSLSESSVTLKSISSLSANVSSISSVQKYKKPLEDSSSDEDFIPSPKQTRRVKKLFTETEDNSFRSSTNLNLESFENNISSLSESSVTLKSISSLSANVSSISSVQKYKKPLEDSSSDEDFIPSPKQTRRVKKLFTETEDNSFRSSTNLKLKSFENNISSLSESSATLKSISSLSANVSSISSVQNHVKPLEDCSSDEDFIPSPKQTRRVKKLFTETEDNSCRSSTRRNIKLNCKKQLFSSLTKKSNPSALSTKIQSNADKDETHRSQNKSNNSMMNRASCSFSKSTSFSSNSSNDTIICNEIYNFDITEDEMLFTNENIKNQSTPQQKVTILSNIVCNRSPQKLSLQKSKLPKSPRQLTKLNAKLIRKASPKKANVSTRVVQEDRSNEEDTWDPICLTLFYNITKFIFSHQHLSTMFTRFETDILNDFLNINNDKYKLFCFKLYMRQMKWQNIFKFTEAIKLEISHIEVKSMYDVLLEKNFVVSDMSLDSCVNLLHTLLVKDIKDICKNFKIKIASCKKGHLIEKLLKHCSAQTTLTLTANTEQVLKKEIIRKMGICVKLNPNFYAILKKLHFAYTFTSNEFEKDADIYWFLRQIQSRDIFMPTYRIDQEVVVFSSIQEFSEYSTASDCKRDIENCFTTKSFRQMLNLCELAYKRLKEYDEAIIDLNCTSKPAHLLHYSARYKYTSALSLGTKYLPKHYPEQVKEFLLYLINNAKYCQHMRGKWLNSLVKLYYVYLKRYEEAADKLLYALKDKTLSDVDLQTLTLRGQLMKERKTNPLPELVKNQISFLQDEILEDFPFIEISSRTTHTNTTGGKRLYIKKNDDETSILSVEKVAIDHYRTKGYGNGIHCEGRLFCTLFCVFFWDIIYDNNVNGAFILETQYYPLDLTTPHFYINRQNAIDQRLNEIKSDWPLGQMENFMLEIWENHSHKHSLISQNLISDANELYEIVLCIGRSKLAKILERIIKNYRLYHSGLPDLFLWETDTKKCKFVEVKGDRDKLSDKQRVWLNFLWSIECDIEVCHVHSIGSKYRAKAVTIKKLKSSA